MLEILTNKKMLLSYIYLFFSHTGRSDVGRFFGNIAKKTFDFFKCSIPGLEKIDHCVRDAIRSTGSCLGGSRNCRMKIGGRGSSCLKFSLTRSFAKSYGKFHFYIKRFVSLNIYSKNTQIHELFGSDLTAILKQCFAKIDDHVFYRSCNSFWLCKAFDWSWS